MPAVQRGRYRDRMQAPRLHAPLVLVHGLLGITQVLVQRLRWVDYFNGIPDWLRASGNEVFIVEMPGVASVARRAEILREQIWHHAGARPVHLIAHSMGGLNARHMIAHLDMARQVRSLVTIGTPHRGSPVADWAVGQAQKTGVFKLIEISPVDQQAFLDLRAQECAAFNTATPDAPSVRYFSVAGDATRERLFLPLRFCYDIVREREGANDGLVSATSAAWGERQIVWAADHVQQIGWRCDGPDGFDWRRAYAELLIQLETA